MPWSVREGVEGCDGWAVVKDEDGSLEGCHPTREEAVAQQAALYASEGAGEGAHIGGGMIALLPADPQALAVEGGDPPEALHVTLFYLGDDARELSDEQRAMADTAAAAVARGVEPFEATVAGYGVLGDQDPPAMVLFLNGAELDAVRVAQDAVPSAPEQHAPWIPHITLGYGVPLEAASTFAGTTIAFDRVALDLGGERTEYALGMDAAGEDEAMSARTATFQDEDEPAMPDEDEPSESAPGMGAWEAVVVVEGRRTDDGRLVERADWREPPLALTWADEITESHVGARRVGTIRAFRRGGAGEIIAAGDYLDSDEGQVFRQRVQEGTAGWPSISLSDMTEELEEEADGRITLRMTGRIVGVSIVPEQAQEGTSIRPVEAMEAAAPVAPPAAWFADPDLDDVSPLEVTDEGRIYGHIGSWQDCHIGFGDLCRTPPRNPDKAYSRFRCGSVRTAEGIEVPTGTLQLHGGHAGPQPTIQAAMAHYAETRSAVADVAAGEDEHGIWIAGALRPGVGEDDLRILRASAPSGDWRGVRGGPMELIAVTMVNTPGFVARRLVASAEGEIEALQIAGPTLEVTGEADLPLAPRDHAWDAGGASGRVQGMCRTDGGDLDGSCFSRAFLWRDPDADPATVGAYHLGFADVVNGRLQAVPRGVFAVAGVLSGARGGANIPQADQERIRGRVNAYYAKMRDAFEDPSIVPPWDEEASLAASAELDARMEVLLDRRALDLVEASARRVRKW